MDPLIEIAALSGLFAVTLWWLRPRGAIRWAAFALWIGVVVVGLLRPAPEPGLPLPVPHTEVGHVSSDTCRGCHPAEYATWAKTYHRTMTQGATPEAVRGRFEGEIETRGQRFALERQGDGFYIKLLDDPEATWERIVMTTGSHHFQNYWVEENGWYVQFPFVWRIAEEEWVPVVDSFLQPAPDAPERPIVWNRGCIHCHMTGGDPGEPEDPEGAASPRAAELGIACEACHRGAAVHVAAMKNPIRRYLRHFDGEADPTLVNPEREDHQVKAQVCGRCHAVSVPDPKFSEFEQFLKPGERLDRDRLIVQVMPNPIARGERLLPARAGTDARVTVETPNGPVEARISGIGGTAIYLASDKLKTAGVTRATLRDPLAEDDKPPHTVRGRLRPYPGGAELTLEAPPAELVQVLANTLGYGELSPAQFDLDAFWNDGAVRTVGREYNGLVKSGCFLRGEMSCGSCHAMHDYAGSDDMLLPGMDGDGACVQCHESYTEDVAAHTHHAPESAGSRCLNCHMPNTTYGLLGATRAHNIDSPNAGRSAATGRPNACNLCHLDKTLAWAGEQLSAWFGQPAAELEYDERTYAAGTLWLTRGDAAQRAVAAWHTAWPPTVEAAGRDWVVPLVIDLLTDEYAAVRAIAQRALAEELEGLDYHFVGTPAAARSATRAAQQRWIGAQHTRAGRPLGLSAPGVRDEAALRGLRRQRDPRPIRISE